MVWFLPPFINLQPLDTAFKLPHKAFISYFLLGIIVIIILVLCFYISVTEDEITRGIFDIPSPEESCLCYARTMTGLHHSLEDTNASKFVDILPNMSPPSIDTDAQRLLHDLKHRKLPQTLPNLRHYSIPWVSGELSKLVPDHNLYLNQLCEHVRCDIKNLVDRAVRRKSERKSALQSEVLHHSTLCLNKCALYCDRRDGVMTKMLEYVCASTSHSLIVHGKSGAGKTSVLAKAAKSMQEWNKGIFVVVRFLGTSPQSSCIRDVLVSICDQICSLYLLPSPAFSEMETLDIIQYFRNELFSSLAKSPNQKLILLLDSVDQLSSTDGAHSMKWLPLNLPANVKIVISMLDDLYCGNKSSLLSQCELELGSMPVEAGLEIVDLWLSKIGQKVTTKQKTLISKAFVGCPQPLFLKLVFGLARTWKSYTDCSSIVIPCSTKEALSQFYDSLEERFGKVLVRKALGYFTAAQSGLTEAELEDVLSLDDEVLNDSYQYWDPPVEGIVRIPSLLWKRIRHHINDYVVEQQADGMTVLVWYHRQFNESALSRYVEEGESTKVNLHFTLSEFFEGTWGNGRSKGVRLMHRNLDLNAVSRQVLSQPMLFSEAVYNYRKLGQLPYHLIYSVQFSKLKNLVLCSYFWMHTKLKATAFTALIQDYILALKVAGNDEDISLICETLSLSSNNIKSNPDLLAGQLLGRLLQVPSSSIHQLLDDAKKWANSSKKSVFQPLNSCLVSPGGELKATITGHSSVVLGVAKASSLPLLVSYSKSRDYDVFQVWDLTSLECIENVFTFKLYGKDFLRHFNYALIQDHLIAACAQFYTVWNIKSGDCIQHVEQLEDGMVITCVAAVEDSQCFFLGTASGDILCSNNLLPLEFCTKLKLSDAVISLHTEPTGTLCLVMSGKDKLSVFSIATKSDLKSTTCDHTDFTTFLVCDQFHLVAGTSSGKVCFSDVSNLTFAAVGGAHNKAVKCISRISSAKLVVTGSLDKTLCVWDIAQRSLLRQLVGHMDGVWCLDSIPGTLKVVSGSKDDYLKVWDTVTGECLHTLEGHSSWVSCVAAVSSDVVVSGSNDKNLKFWRLDSNKKMHTSSSRHSAQPECIALSGSTLAASGGPDAIKVWNPLDGKCLHSLPTSATCLLFTGKHLVAGSKKGVIEVYDTANWSKVKVICEHKDKVTGLLPLVLEAQDFWVSISLDTTLRMWNCSDFHESCIAKAHTSSVTCVTSSQSKLASGCQDGKISLWNVQLSERSGVLEGHRKTVNCIRYSMDGTRLISGSDDTTARVWSIADLTCVHIISYTDSVKALCVMDDASFIAGAHCGCDQLKSWNMESGLCVNDFVGHTHAVMCMLVIDEHHILSGSRDGTVKLWNYATAELLSSFDLQSQVKHITISKSGIDHFLLASTTKSGPIAFFEF